ncbi:MAG: GDP-mannose 4,6-dehydratase [Candidatus Pacebacteria bacterium]|nr:GDP-mannose 4,6-dehydratase [Candidatus Paceibacterota bacterium]MCF7856947.1 GDP-mannose 4,6-dehydratase [Candidatus Paceibacterota bacterium]
MSTRSKRAFITGVYGQDGSYLAEVLLDSGYEVLGLVSPSDKKNQDAKLFQEKKEFSLFVANLEDAGRIVEKLEEFRPHEIYNLAAVSDLKTAKERPEYTYDINYTAFKNLVTHATDIDSSVKIFQALSSRILVPNTQGVIEETSQFSEPSNAYDKAKRDSYTFVRDYRDRGFFVASGFLCNHESPRRGPRFVTGKIARGVIDIENGAIEKIYVGNVNALRDWSHAKDVVRAMYAVLQVPVSDDYVIGSGELHSVRDFISEAFNAIKMPLTWAGEGIDTYAVDLSGTVRVAVDPEFFQVDDNPVVSNTKKLKTDTGWSPKISFSELISEMVEAERL